MPIDVMCTCSECAEAEAPLKIDLAKIMNLQVKMDFLREMYAHFILIFQSRYIFKLNWIGVNREKGKVKCTLK